MNLEAAFIGSILKSPETLDDAIAILEPENGRVFSDSDLARLYDLCYTTYIDYGEIDPLVVTRYARRTNAKLVPLIQTCLDSARTPNNAHLYARVLKEEFARRTLSQHFASLLSELKSGKKPVSELLSDAFTISTAFDSHVEEEPLEQLIEDALRPPKRLINAGIPQLDERI